jgi:hypothetical protein
VAVDSLSVKQFVDSVNVDGMNLRGKMPLTDSEKRRRKRRNASLILQPQEPVHCCAACLATVTHPSIYLEPFGYCSSRIASDAHDA